MGGFDAARGNNLSGSSISSCSSGLRLIVEPGFESLIGLRGFGQIAGAEVIFGESFAEQLFTRGVAAGGDLIDERLKQLDGCFEVVVSIGEDAAIELGLIGRQSIELRFNAQKLMVG